MVFNNMKQQLLYLSPDAWAIESRPGMPLCTSATIEGFQSSDDDFNMFNIY